MQSVADTAYRALVDNAVEVRRRNLFAMSDGKAFSPLLTDAERLAYFDEGNQPQLTRDAHVADLVDSLRWCEGLVLVYPTWWFNLPAMLKGFFE